MEQKMYSHRGFMLDVCRHYMPVENIKKLIKAAEICGLNRMHWHLADDQGWRIEIKKYPKLTLIGSERGPSFFGDVSEIENNCGYYTQEEARDIVAFAKEHGIEIIPEIELPGHASAMLASYPEYGCRRTVMRENCEQMIENPYEYKVENAGGIFPNLICAGKDEAVTFLKNIMDEVVDLFPFEAVHIGGDEALKLHWRRCPDCQKRMKELGLKDEEELQRWLVLEMGEYLHQKGKNTIVFNDCLAGGMLPKYFIVHHWMGNNQETAEFMKTGGKVIYSDIEHFYFDYPYSSIDVHHIWETPRIPEYAIGYEENLLGMECMLWTERITNVERAAYLLFPRVAAASIKAMKADEIKSWEQFEQEVKKIQEQIETLGLIGAPQRDWKLSREAAEADRLAEKKRRTSPGALQAERTEERLLLQEKLEKALGEVELPKAFALQVMDCAWNIE